MTERFRTSISLLALTEISNRLCRPGYIYGKRAEYDRAIQDFNQAISLDPKFAPAFFGRGLANFNSARFSEAARDFGRSSDLDPSDLYDVRWLHVARAKSQQDDAQELAHKGPRVIRPKIMISSIGFRGPD
jgi:lipoprotein NlpI